MRVIQTTVLLTVCAVAFVACSPDAHDLLAPDVPSVDLPGAVAAAVVTPALPFHGTVEASETHFISGAGVFYGHVVGTGIATHLGRFTLEDDEVGDPATLSADVSLTLRAADGDIVTGTGTAQVTPAPGFVSFTSVETVTVTGGTGRFAGATGSFVLERVVDIAAGSPYPSTGSFTGSITLAR